MKEKLARLEARNKERMILIEKGHNPEDFLKEKKRAGWDPLFWGFLLAGIGLGLFVGYRAAADLSPAGAGDDIAIGCNCRGAIVASSPRSLFCGLGWGRVACGGVICAGRKMGRGACVFFVAVADVIFGAQDVRNKIVYSANEKHPTHPRLPAGLFVSEPRALFGAADPGHLAADHRNRDYEGRPCNDGLYEDLELYQDPEWLAFRLFKT